jgi:hypothetical protein
MKGLGIETKITLKNIVLGYKINDHTPNVQAPFGVSLLHLVLIIQGYNQNYMKYIYNLNTVLGYKIDVGFSIYKSYYIYKVY